MATESTTTIFVRDEAAVDGAPFVAVEHRGSITLQTLMESHDCSCVVECDQSGRAQPRAVVIDNPQEALHRGTFYLSRSRKRRDRGGDESNTASAATAAVLPSVTSKAVHFNTRVAVREYSIPMGRTNDEVMQQQQLNDAENIGRPSIDLFAVKPADVALGATTTPNVGTPSQLCFKTFHAISPTDGTPIVVTLDVFHRLVQESKSRLEGAVERHEAAMREIENVEAFLQQHVPAAPPPLAATAE